MSGALPVFHDPGFRADLGNGHRMPIGKFDLVADRLRASRHRLAWPAIEPVKRAQLKRVHTAAYIDAVQSGEPRALAESQKFPWSAGLYPSVCLTGGACLQAARAAVAGRVGAAAALVSGFHHAHADHGEGFCTFNGLVVAADVLHHDEGLERIAVLDLDLHYGNGTASLCGPRPHLRALSIYGNDYMNNTPHRDASVRRHDDGPNHRSVPLLPGCDGPTMRAVVEREFGWLLEGGLPDVLLYQAGADPLRDDPYSPLDLGHDDLRARDALVFRLAREAGVPVAWVLAGGYTEDVEQVVRVHVGTFDAWFNN